ncbi:hypothetical protein EYF80_020703 [Liparis tanakae]|uniref:Uncharacterized protein n=1 Tax=Liparis tanakae TaxID=230148 RepID=A0A4Z2HTZ2_9TELE|nr:hypothetical protein EYF80_020703 [Liparis tanakae]
MPCQKVLVSYWFWVVSVFHTRIMLSPTPSARQPVPTGEKPSAYTKPPSVGSVQQQSREARSQHLIWEHGGRSHGSAANARRGYETSRDEVSTRIRIIEEKELLLWRKQLDTSCVGRPLGQWTCSQSLSLTPGSTAEPLFFRYGSFKVITPAGETRTINILNVWSLLPDAR